MFKEYVRGKRIAVVGPASSISGTGQKDYIDGFDIVMRFNSAIPISDGSKNDIGTRTDILCNCLEEHPISGGHIDPLLWKNNGVSWVLCPYPRELWYVGPNVNRFESLNKGMLNLQCTDVPFFNGLESKLGTRPNSGFLGILYLLSFDVNEVYVTGITFGRGGYHKGYKDDISAEQYNKLANSHIHQQKPQEKIFSEIFKNESRLSVDVTLKEILEN